MSLVDWPSFSVAEVLAGSPAVLEVWQYEGPDLSPQLRFHAVQALVVSNHRTARSPQDLNTTVGPALTPTALTLIVLRVNLYPHP